MTSVPPRPDASNPTDTGTPSPVTDEPTASRRIRRLLLPGCLMIGVLLIGGPLVATAILDGSAPAGDIQTLGFGTGGSGCNLDRVTRTVTAGTPVHMVGTFSPELSSGSKVVVTVSVDGTAQPDLGGTIDIATPSDCVNGTIAPHLPGHYVVRLKIEPSTMSALEGTFDVNP